MANRIPLVLVAGQIEQLQSADAISITLLSANTITISGHSVTLGGSVSLVAADVGLGNVTNDIQTKASIVPNTAPSSGQILVGNAGGTAYVPQTVSGSGATITLASTGVITISAIPNTTLSNSSVTISTSTGLSGGGSVSLGGTLTLSLVTPVSATNGGSGVSNPTAHAVLLGEGSSAFGSATIGTAGRLLLDQGAGADPSFQAMSNDATITSGGVLTISSLKGYIYNLNLIWGSTTTLTVTAGQCRDSTNAATLVIASNTSMDVTNQDAITGNDAKQLSGTVATNSSNATVTGTSTAFLTDFNTRTGSGTITSSGTTVTGTSTKFLSEVAVGDLIGSNAKGFSRVTAIASDVSLTIVAAIPGGSPGGVAPLIIENAWVQCHNQTVQRVNTITSNTSLALAANSSATESGINIFAGGRPSFTAFYYVHVINGGSGTTLVVSSQRTTPYAHTGFGGYTTYFRRIGCVLLDGSGNVASFDQYGSTNDRWYQYEVGQGGNQQILTNGANTAWTGIVASLVAPPSALVLRLGVSVITGGTAGIDVFFRARGIGDSTTTRELYAGVDTTNGNVHSNLDCVCDGAQVIDYATTNTASGNGIYIYVTGYMESL